MKNLSKKKKIIILSVMVALLLITGFVNVALNNSFSSGVSKQTGATVSTYSFYANYRSTRDATRAQEIQFYDSIINSDAYSEDAKKEAYDNKMALVKQMEKELVTESMIIGSGFNDAVITASSENINIFVKCAELTKEEVARIASIAIKEFGVEIDKIIITPSE